MAWGKEVREGLLLLLLLLFLLILHGKIAITFCIMKKMDNNCAYIYSFVHFY